jgi:dATP pyrophosphohydrolase
MPGRPDVLLDGAARSIDRKGASAPFSFFALQSLANPSTDMQRDAADCSLAMPKPPKIPESVLVVIHTPALDVLLIQRAGGVNLWQSVTGSKNAIDEPLGDTAMREVAEETGIVIGRERVPRDALVDWHHQIEFEIFPVWRHRYAEGVTTNIEHWFGLQVPSSFEVTLAPHEHIAQLWLPYQEAAARCFSWSNRDAILQLPERVKGRWR